MYFFSRWWNNASIEQKYSIHQLIEEDRFEFVNGGWVSPDEACTDYNELIDNI
jgi:hypothetical protein